MGGPIFLTPISATGEPGTPAVTGEGTTSGEGNGVFGRASGLNSAGVSGQGKLIGVEGLGLGGGENRGIGVRGTAGGGGAGDGVLGVSVSGNGVLGVSTSWRGVSGFSTSNDGVWGETRLAGQSGVVGFTELQSAAGITGINKGGGLAGDFEGNVRIT